MDCWMFFSLLCCCHLLSIAVIIILVVFNLLLLLKQKEKLKNTENNYKTLNKLLKNGSISKIAESEISSKVESQGHVFRIVERISELEDIITKQRIKNNRRKSLCHTKRQSVCEDSLVFRRKSRINSPSESEDQF